MSDLIDRDAAIAFVDCGYLRPPTELAWSDKDVVDMLKRVPSAQPTQNNTSNALTSLDCIDRQAAIEVADAVWSVTGDKNVAKVWDQLKDLPSAQPQDIARDIATIIENEKDMRVMLQQQWIPVTERLPEEDVEVLITYRYKEGEGDTSHAYIDITTYGQMYFGGNKVGDHKHWRQPFEYFTSNYEVVAWMSLPEPWKGEEE